MYPGMPAPAEHQPERGDDPGVRGLDSQPAGQPEHGPPAEQTHLRDAVLLLRRLGHGRGAATAFGEPRQERRKLVLASNHSAEHYCRSGGEGSKTAQRAAKSVGIAPMRST